MQASATPERNQIFSFLGIIIGVYALVAIVLAFVAAFYISSSAACQIAGFEQFVKFWPANERVIATIAKLDLKKIDACKVVFSNSAISMSGILAVVIAFIVLLFVSMKKIPIPAKELTSKEKEKITRGFFVLILVNVFIPMPFGITSISETKVRRGLDIGSTTITAVLWSAAWIYYFYMLICGTVLLFGGRLIAWVRSR